MGGLRDGCGTIIGPMTDRVRFSEGEPVDVLCDGTGRIGSLSYLVPSGMRVTVGDAVHVPFGKREVVGVVLGPGDEDRATREIIRRYGKRSDPATVRVARDLAAFHCVPLQKVATRLAPKRGKGADVPDAESVVLAGGLPAEPAGFARIPSTLPRRTLLRAPLVDPAVLAAREAERLVRLRGGQALVLCPTAGLVGEVLAAFDGGARRLDRKADYGAWKGFVEGTVPVGVGTRAAALYRAETLSAVIVVEEQHPGHVEASQPSTHAREVAARRADAAGAVLSVISPHPSPDALGGQMKVRSVGSPSADWPGLRLIDRTQEPPFRRDLPEPLRRAWNRLAEQGPTVALAERRRTRRRCGRCHRERSCQACAEVGQPEALCRHIPDPQPCGACGDTSIWIAGWDADRLRATLPEAVEVTSRAGLERRRGQAGVLIFDIDGMLRSRGATATAEALRLLLSAMAAVAPDGELVVGTSLPDHPVLVDLFKERDLRAAAQRAWQTAKEQRLPPFGRLVTVQVGWQRPPRTSHWPGQVLGPRQRGEEWEILVRCSDEEFDELRPLLWKLRQRGKVRIHVR